MTGCNWLKGAAACLLAVGITIGIAASQATAGNADSVKIEGRSAEPIVTAQLMRGAKPRINPKIVVSRFLTGRVITRSSMLTVSFQVDAALMAQPIFQLKLLKGRAHAIKHTWMGSRRIDPPRTYQAQWRVPATFDPGADYFVCVTHLPTRNTGCSGLFTIR